MRKKRSEKKGEYSKGKSKDQVIFVKKLQSIERKKQRNKGRV